SPSSAEMTGACSDRGATAWRGAPRTRTTTRGWAARARGWAGGRWTPEGRGGGGRPRVRGRLRADGRRVPGAGRGDARSTMDRGGPAPGRRSRPAVPRPRRRRVLPDGLGRGVPRDTAPGAVR